VIIVGGHRAIAGFEFETCGRGREDAFRGGLIESLWSLFGICGFRLIREGYAKLDWDMKDRASRHPIRRKPGSIARTVQRKRDWDCWGGSRGIPASPE
jgi:hypothetical protein